MGLWHLENIKGSLLTPHESDENTAGLWHLDGTTGDVGDASANGNDGANNGPTRGETGQIDSCFDFDGANDYVEIPDDDHLPSSSVGNRHASTARTPDEETALLFY